MKTGPAARVAVSALLLLPASSALADETDAFELGLLAGWQQTGAVDTDEGEVDLDGGILSGLSGSWRVRADGLVELAWWRQESEATAEPSSGQQAFGVTIDTLELGGLWEARPGERSPFLALSLGATRVAGPDQDSGEGWHGSGAIAGGMRYRIGERAILRVEGRATGILISDGGVLACAFPPGGCALGVNGSLIGAFSARVALAARF